LTQPKPLSLRLSPERGSFDTPAEYFGIAELYPAGWAFPLFEEKGYPMGGESQTNAGWKGRARCILTHPKPLSLRLSPERGAFDTPAEYFGIAEKKPLLFEEKGLGMS
jgi:hypothetical protein